MRYHIGKLTPSILLLMLLFLAACIVPGGTLPVKKIGLLSPFEGVQRQNGYQRLYGVKLALQEINRTGGVAGYKIELVALNDFAQSAEAILQAQEFVIDSDVIGVIGEWDGALFADTAPIFDAAGLAVIAPVRFTNFDALPPTFDADFSALAGSPPDEQARQAYLATRALVDLIDRAAQTGRLNRAAVHSLQ